MDGPCTGASRPAPQQETLAGCGDAARPRGGPAAGEELCALLAELKQAGGLSYDALAVAAAMGRNTVLNYITKPGHRRDTRTVEQLLTALRAPGPARDRALELHRRMSQVFR